MRSRWLLLTLISLLSLSLVMPVGGSVAREAPPAVPTLVEIRAARHPGYDRIVFEFRGGLPASRQVRYVDKLVGDGSGLPVRIAGRAILEVRLEPAHAHDEDGQTVPQRLTFALPNIMTAVRSGDYEAVTTYGVGLAKRTRFEVLTLRKPDRVVIDIATSFPTVQRRVWFFNQKRYLENREPFFTPTWRPVPAAIPGTGVLDRLFAGVTPAEQARGLRLLRSGANGFEKLAVNNGVARVHLTGRCSSGGSTVTVAGEIMPTLRQFASVDWVKIYDSEGNTGQPSGRSDSVPECLEP